MNRRARWTGSAFFAAVAVAFACTTTARQQSVAAPIGDPYDACIHLAVPWSDYWCPDSNTNFRVLSQVDSISLTIRTKDGVHHVTPINPMADIIFLDGMSVDSVLAGYYSSKGARDTASVRKLNALRARAARPRQ